MKKLLTILFIGMFLLSFATAEEVLWDDDSDIVIIDSWENYDGSPMVNANCTYTLYNSDYSLNQTLTFIQSIEGIVNFTINKLSIDTYPLIINCSSENKTGISTKNSIKIIDELSEEYKARLEELNITTKEINQTTHEIKDFLEGQINDTLTSLLTFNYTDNLTDILNNLTIINNQVEENYDYLVEKWGNEDADEIVNRLKDLNSDIKNLNFRIEFMNPEDISSTLLSIRGDSSEVLSIINGDTEKQINRQVWYFWGGVLLLFLIIVLLIARRKKK